MENKELESELKKRDAEIERLKGDIEKAREYERELEKSRRAILFMMEDLNESRATIERGKREWEATFDAISIPLFIHDRESKIVRANKAYRDAAGMDFNDFIGKPYFEVFPMMDRPFKMCLKAMELEEEEVEEVLLPDGRIFKARFYPIKDNEGRHLYSIHALEDITEAKMAAERLKEEMEVTSHLLMIAEATAHTTDIDKLMEQVVHCGHEIIGCDICLSYLWDTETKVFRSSQAFGLSHDLIPFFTTESLDMKVGVVKEAMRKREPTLTLRPLPEGEGKIKMPSPIVGEETKKAPSPLRGEGWGEGVFPWLPGIKTIAVIPLIGKKGPLGLIMGIYVGAGFKPAPTIEERDMKVMQGIMHQVSVALEQASLYKESVEKEMELSHRIETIQVMHEIDRSILSTLEAQEILEIGARLTGKVIPCDRVTIVSVNMERQMYNWVAGFGTEFLPKLRTAPFDVTSATETVIRQGRPEFVANLMDINDPLPVEKGLIKEGFLSHIRVPLIVKGEIVGILTIGSKSPSAFSPEDLSTLEKLAYQIGVALSNARLLSDLEELFLGTVKSLSSAIDAKSPWTAGHSGRVTKYALDIGREMGLSEKYLRDLELTGLLHDVGKIGTYEHILDKPDRLTDDEIRIMRQHPVKGAEILAPIKQLKNVIPSIMYHHEFYDGNGYPDGLKGEEIPLFARILTVADTVDAMGADRPYRKGKSLDEIIAEMKRCSWTQFDPKVVDSFLNILPKMSF